MSQLVSAALLALLLSSQAWAHADFVPVNGGKVSARDGTNTGYPSIVKVPAWVPSNQRPSPNANYYMYYGRHSGAYIYMKWAETITGDWTAFHLGGTYNGHTRHGVLDPNSDATRDNYAHVAHPDVYVDDVNQRFILFFHGKAQPDATSSGGTFVPQKHGQFVSTSAYGLNFNDPVYAGGEAGHGPRTVQIDNITREMIIAGNYMRVFRYRGDWYSVSRRALLDKAPNPTDPLQPDPDPFANAWLRENTPTDLFTNDAWVGAPGGVSEGYNSPGCSFVASSEFAAHPNNPNPGVRISCNGSSGGERLNHVGANLLADHELLEVYFYVKEDPSDRFDDLYRIIYDISDPDFQNWHVKRDGNGQALFEVYLTDTAVDTAIAGSYPTYANPSSMGTSDIFIDDDDTQYLFFSFVAPFYGDDGEGQIAAVQIDPQCSNGIDDDNDGDVDYPDDTDCASAAGVAEFPLPGGSVVCGNGALEGAEQCDDGNTVDGDCCSSTCTFETVGSSCGDGTVCNGLETCDGAGTCDAGTPLVCDDANGCTNDSCDTVLGCQYVDNADPCDDANACTLGDICVGGSCQAGGPLDCNDANGCTNDSCDSVLGCQYVDNADPCDDADACTTGEACGGGSCQAGGPTDCDDADECTADSCDQLLGCAHDPIPLCGASVPSASAGGRMLVGLLLMSAGVVFLFHRRRFDS